MTRGKTLSGAFADTSNDQLMQAMAGFGAGGTSDGLNALGTDYTATAPGSIVVAHRAWGFRPSKRPLGSLAERPLR
jgi:hypothetical protein